MGANDVHGSKFSRMIQVTVTRNLKSTTCVAAEETGVRMLQARPLTNRKP